MLSGHPSGGKARFFAALGYTGDNWAEFEVALREQHLVLDAEEVESTEWGTMYAIVGPITGPSGERADVRSIWIIERIYPGSSPRIQHDEHIRTV